MEPVPTPVADFEPVADTVWLRVVVAVEKLLAVRLPVEVDTEVTLGVPVLDTVTLVALSATTNPLTNAGPVSGCHCHNDTPAGALAVLNNHPANTVGSTQPLPASVTSIGFPTNMWDVGTP